MLTPYAPNRPCPAKTPRASNSNPYVNSEMTRHTTSPALPAKRLLTIGVNAADRDGEHGER